MCVSRRVFVICVGFFVRVPTVGRLLVVRLLAVRADGGECIRRVCVGWQVDVYEVIRQCDCYLCCEPTTLNFYALNERSHGKHFVYTPA